MRLEHFAGIMVSSTKLKLPCADGAGDDNGVVNPTRERGVDALEENDGAGLTLLVKDPLPSRKKWFCQPCRKELTAQWREKCGELRQKSGFVNQAHYEAQALCGNNGFVNQIEIAVR